MKTQLLRTLYRLVAFLADSTKGFRLFAQWKVALGSLLMGIVATSYAAKNNMENDEPLPPPIREVTCYKPAINVIRPVKSVEPFKVDTVIDVKEAIRFIPDDSIPAIVPGKQDLDGMEIDNVMAGYPDVPAQFIGGNEKILEFISANLQYPQEAKEQKIEGRVYVKFMVGKDGSVSEIKILKGFRADCNEEAIRVVSSMPKWIPAKEKNEDVSSHYIVPVKFELPK